MRVVAVVNTKGGSGKSTIAWHILPSFFENPRVLEIDNNNRTVDVLFNSEIARRSRTIGIKESEEALGEILFEMLSGKNETVIIDAGGGDDTRAVIEKIKDLEFEEIDFIVPLMGGMAQKKNAEDTYDLIKDRGRVFFFLNKFNQQEFAFWYGDNELGIAPSSFAAFKEVIKVPYSPLFEISTLRGETIADLSKHYDGLSAKEAREQIFEATQGNKELFLKQLNIYKQAKRAREILALVKGQFERILYDR